MSDLSAATGTWTIDPAHTNIGFSARHAMVAKVRGNFSDYEGSLTFDGSNIGASTAELKIAAASISTGNADRDGHLMSPDFLDVAQFPEITFRSTKVTQKGDDEFIVTGDLTIHGTTKSVDVKFELLGVSQDPFGNTKIGFEGEAKISRKEFGLEWNAVLETGGVLVGDEIKLNLDVEATKA